MRARSSLRRAPFPRPAENPLTLPQHTNMLTLNTTRLMKSPSLILAIASLTVGLASAVAQSVTTDPVGFTTLTAKGSSFSVVGLNMVKPVAYQGVVSGVAGATVTDANANFDTALTAGKKYFVEIISGDYAGLNAEVVSWSGSSITISGDVSAIAGALTGAGHRIRESWTLGSVFGAANQAGLQSGATASAADVIYAVDPATGSFRLYYYQTGALVGGEGWRTPGNSFGDQSNVALYFTDGLIVQRRAGTDLNLKLVGAVKTGRTIVGLRQGYNLVANPYPVTDINLGNSGLFASGTGFSLSAGATLNASDVVYLPRDAGGYDLYYYQVGALVGGEGWRLAGSAFTDRAGEALSIGKSFFVQRRGADTSVILQPTF